MSAWTVPAPSSGTISNEDSTQCLIGQPDGQKWKHEPTAAAILLPLTRQRPAAQYQKRCTTLALKITNLLSAAMVSSLLGLFIALLACCSVGLAENTWINPPSGGDTGVYTGPNINDYALGSTISLRWNVDYDKMSLSIIQTNLSQPNVPGSEHYLFKNQTDRSTYSWTVNVMDMFDLDWSNVFWFRVYNEAGGGWAPSAYINITEAKMAAPAASSTPSVTAVPASRRTQAASTGMSESAKIGIGVGVGVGVAGILIGIGIVVFMKRRGRRSSLQERPPSAEVPLYSQQAYPQAGFEQRAPFAYRAYNGGPVPYETRWKEQLSPQLPTMSESGGGLFEQGFIHELENRSREPQELPARSPPK